jgi:hypothetical protein
MANKKGAEIVKIPKELLFYIFAVVSVSLLGIYAIFALDVSFANLGIIGLLILIGACSRLPQKIAPVSIGVELISLVTIVSALKFGPATGAAVGALSMGLSGAFTIPPERPQDLMIATLGFVAMGFITPVVFAYLGSYGLTALTVTVMYDFATSLLYIFLGHSVFGCFRFSVIHIPSNYFIVQYLAPKLMGI